MKYIYAANLVLIMASCLGITAQGQTERQEPTSESVPDSLQLLTKQSLSNFPNFTRDIIEWPDNAKAKRSKLNRSNPLVAAGISNTVNWLAQVLQPNWIPSLGESSSVVAPLALKGDVQGNDAVRLRYKRHDSVIQVVSTSSGLNLLIQDTAPPKKDRLIGQAEAINYIAKKMDQYLQHSEEIKAVSLKLVREQGQGFRGDPNVRPETCNNWWGLVGWWTERGKGSVRDSWNFLKRLAPQEAFWISGVLYLSHGLGYRRPMTHPQGCADPPSIHTRLPAKPPPQRLFPIVSLLEQPHLVRRHSHSLQGGIGA